MPLSHSGSQYLVTVGGVLMEVDYATVTLEVQGLEVTEQISEGKTTQSGCGIVQQALAGEVVSLDFKQHES